MRNERGQGLIEYLIIVALVAIAGIAVMKVVGQNIHAQFATVANAIQGKSATKAPMEEVRKSYYRKKDMSDFFRGSANRKNQNSDE